MSLRPERFTRIPITELASPKRGGLHMVIKDHWWALDKDANAFFFDKTSPQCNANKSIVERLKTHPDMVSVFFVPIVMFPVSPSDYV